MENHGREKTLRRLKKKRTITLQGYQIYHNYIRPHEALEGKTPAETNGKLIENAIKTNAKHCLYFCICKPISEIAFYRHRRLFLNLQDILK